MSHDVTGCLAFGKNIEIFFDYEVENPELIAQTGDVFVKEEKEDIVLSKGATETKHPLPVVSALMKNFIKEVWKTPEGFLKISKPDENVIKEVFKQTIIDLNLDDSHLEEPQWISPAPITTEEGVTFPLVFEIYYLLLESYMLFYNGGDERLDNGDRRFINFLKNEYMEYINFIGETEKQIYIMNQRLVQPQALNDYLRPIAIKPKSKLVTITRNEKKVEKMVHEEPTFTFVIRSNAGLLTLAWAELYFAKMYEVPFSICTYCGQVYLFGNKDGKKSINKSCCGKDSCKNTMRKLYEQQKRMTPEDDAAAKEDIRKRKRRSRDKAKVKDLVLQGKKISEIMKIINDKAKERGFEERTEFEIKKWIKEAKKQRTT